MGLLKTGVFVVTKLGGATPCLYWVGIEHAIEYTNRNCLNRDPTGNLEYQLGAIEGVDKCLFGLRGDRQRYAFKWGRKDCQSDTSQPLEEALVLDLPF